MQLKEQSFLEVVLDENSIYTIRRDGEIRLYTEFLNGLSYETANEEVVNRLVDRSDSTQEVELEEI